MDDSDECVIEFDGPVEVVLAQTATEHVLSLRSAISGAGTPDHELLQWALETNFTSMLPGCALAFDDAAQQLALVALVDADQVSPGHLMSLLAGFVELVPRLRAQYEALVHDTDLPGGFAGAFA